MGQPSLSAGRRWGAWACLALAVTLAACSSGSKKPEPTPLAPLNALMNARQAWSANVGTSGAPLLPAVAQGRLAVGALDGTVALLDGQTGRDVWRINAGARLAAGVGTDGRHAAVVTVGNELVVITDGRVSWRSRLPARTFTPPLVAGARVFVLTADRSVTAFDAANGARLWVQNRPGDALALQQAGVLMALGDTLVVGQSGRLVGLNPNTGASRWEATLAAPRGSNEIERLVDVVAGVGRQGTQLCARAFQATVGCVDTARGTTIWTQTASGSVGVSDDERWVYGTESTGRVRAWRRSDGEPAWSTDRFLHRGLTAPLAAGRSVVFGDAQGLVHLVSRDDGSPLNRLTTDGSPIVAAPVLVGNTLVAVTRNGGVFAWRPE